MRIFGVDFTSRPRAGKPIVVAAGLASGGALRVEALRRLPAFGPFEEFLQSKGPWVGAFDFPFGLPARFVAAHAPCADWESLVSWARSLGREGFCAVTYPAFRAAKGRPADKNRRVDAAAGSHSPLKTMDVMRRKPVNPPVGLMFFEGAPRLAASGACIPGLRPNRDPRIALEAYPGYLARRLGVRRYKNDRPHDEGPRAQRRRLLDALRDGSGPLGVQVTLPPAVVRDALSDPSGDAVDALLAAVQAAWCAARARRGYGLPADVHPLEGWIATVPG
jgi:hypothetical protein